MMAAGADAAKGETDDDPVFGYEGCTGRGGAVKAAVAVDVEDTSDGRATREEGFVGATIVASVAVLAPVAAAAAANDGGKAAVRRLPGGGAMLETTDEDAAEDPTFLCKMDRRSIIQMCQIQ
jgi:hypothetical protein